MKFCGKKIRSSLGTRLEATYGSRRGCSNESSNCMYTSAGTACTSNSRMLIYVTFVMATLAAVAAITVAAAVAAVSVAV